jgi:T5SS/PEP-CTERM-associated repeat protein
VIATTSTAAGSSVNLTGAGSNWQVSGALQVGAAATGELSIANGATVSATTLDAGIQANSAGIVTVTGTNADLTTTGSLSVGDTGSGELSILNGANVSIGGDFDIGGTAGGTGNVDIEDATGTVFVGGNLNIGFGGPAVLTVGPTSTLEVDNGLVNGGPEGVLNLYTSIDPPAFNGDTVNIIHSQTQNLPAYTESSSFSIAQGVIYTLNTPTIYGTSSFTLGTPGDTLPTQLNLNADSVSASTSINFSNALGVLVIGTDDLAKIDTPASGSGPFTSVTNPSDGLPVIGGFKGVINGFVAGDTIAVDGPATFLSPDGAVIDVIENGTTVGVLTFSSPAAAQTAFTTKGALVDHAMCFLAGTLIRTPGGETAVERLAVGDPVATAGGQVRPIVWIGSGRVLATRGRRDAATPVIVRKGALAPNVPHADLRVTKGHSFWLDEVLIPVEFLVNHRSILWDDRAQEVCVYHIELETHDVLLANGAAAESFRNDGNRWLFQNAYSGWDLQPQEPCAPVLTGGAVVDAVWRRLLDRAGVRPSVPLTDDADVCLVVDGVRVDASTRTDDVHVFGVSASADAVRLVSRAAVPQELGVARDPRLLGVAVRRVAVRQGTRFRVVPAADALLAEGFHPLEAGAGLRWTDGDAVLPGSMFDGFVGAVEVVVHVGGTTRYVDDGVRSAVA